MQNLQEQVAPTLALNSGALAIGSTASQIAIATAVNYLYRGVFGQRTTSASIAFPIVAGTGAPSTPNAYTNVAVGQACSFLIVVKASDNSVAGVQGPIVASDESTPVAAVPEGYLAIGVLKIVNTSVGAFIPGTTLMDVAGITDTYTQLGAHPGRAL